jgi:hypothetical protein
MLVTSCAEKQYAIYWNAYSQLTDTVLVSRTENHVFICDMYWHNSDVLYIDTPLRLIVGTNNLPFIKPVALNRILSVIHSSLTSECSRGNMRTIVDPQVSIRILLHKLSSTSIVSVVIASHTRKVYDAGLIVSAPTGQISATFPIISTSVSHT